MIKKVVEMYECLKDDMELDDTLLSIKFYSTNGQEIDMISGRMSNFFTLMIIFPKWRRPSSGLLPNCSIYLYFQCNNFTVYSYADLLFISLSRNSVAFKP